jgi:hypothetical protein
MDVERLRHCRSAPEITARRPCIPIHEVAQCIQSRPLLDPSAEWKGVAEHKEVIVAWLGRKRPLRLRKIHTLLVRDHGLLASYDTRDGASN